MSCPTPEKVKYPTRDSAVRAGALIRHDLRLVQHPLHPYECAGCGSWHLSSEKSLTARIRSALGGGAR